MSVKKYNIEIPQLDYQVISIGIKKDGEYIELDNDDLIFMTVSYTPGSTDYKFQKSLGDGITYNATTGKYDIQIDSEDTAELQLGATYGYDITIYYEGDKPKQKVVGQFKIGKKYTVNEVSE